MWGISVSILLLIILCALWSPVSSSSVTDVDFDDENLWLFGRNLIERRDPDPGKRKRGKSKNGGGRKPKEGGGKDGKGGAGGGHGPGAGAGYGPGSPSYEERKKRFCARKPKCCPHPDPKENCEDNLDQY